MTVALAIQVPAQCRLDLEVDAGSVEISGVSSEISGRVDAGTLTTRDVTFMDRSEARIDAGNITIEGALGESAPPGRACGRRKRATDAATMDRRHAGRASGRRLDHH